MKVEVNDQITDISVPTFLQMRFVDLIQEKVKFLVFWLKIDVQHGNVVYMSGMCLFSHDNPYRQLFISIIVRNERPNYHNTMK